MKQLYLSAAITALIAGCSAHNVAPIVDTAAPTAYKAELVSQLDAAKAPTQNFDLSKFKINLPKEDTKPARLGKVMEIGAAELNDPAKPFTDPQWFYTDPQTGAVIFKAPNKAMTTPNSKNARSELRAMLNPELPLGYSDPSNNFSVAAHKNSQAFGAIGGELSATMAVDWVSLSGNDKKGGGHSAVIGQIHASHNEPLKIFYRKMPNHTHGSLYWNYETNPTNKADRHDISHDIWGAHGLTKADKDPVDGIMLGEIFSYDVKVVGNIMHLTFTRNINTIDQQTKTFDIDLSKGVASDPRDNGYGQDWMFFKAGVYNQCNVGNAGCSNNGIEAGDYAQTRFYKLSLKQ